MNAPKARPIIQYWHQANVPDYIEELFATYPENNPGRPHLIDEDDAVTFVAENLGPREADALRAVRVPAIQADYFRLVAMYVVGGMWCDADSCCEASLDRLMDIDGGLVFEPAMQGLNTVNNAFLVFGSPGHPFLELALEIATTNIEERTRGFVAGPELLTILVLSQRRGSFAALLSGCRSAPSQPQGAKSPEQFLSALLHGALDHLEPERLERLEETIDTRAAGALEGIQVLPARRLEGLIAHHPWHLPYRDTEDHYANVKGSVYRTARGV